MTAVVLFWASGLLLAYAYVGYPALMWLVGLFASRRAPATSSTAVPPSVSLLIPACNEEAVLDAKLRNALAIDYPRERLEILVGSDASSDRTDPIARSFEPEGVRFFGFHERRGKVSVLNDLVRHATGDVLCLCDANVLFRPDALRTLVGRLGDPRVGAVSGDVRLASHESDFGEGESLYYRAERVVQLGESFSGSLMGVDGGMYVLRRALYRPLPSDTILDDFTLSMEAVKVGARVVYEPSAIASENGTPSSSAEFRRRVRVSAGAIQSLKRAAWPPLSQPIELWQYLSHKPLRWAGPYLLVALFANNVLLWNAGVAYRVLLGFQAAAMIAAAAATISPAFRRTRLGGVPFYFAMSHVAMVVGHVKGLLNAQRVTWGRTARGGAVTEPGFTVNPTSVEPLT